MSDREHISALLMTDCRARSITALLGIPVHELMVRLPTKELVKLRRALPVAPQAALLANALGHSPQSSRAWASDMEA